jgi:hypothetical protein
LFDVSLIEGSIAESRWYPFGNEAWDIAKLTSLGQEIFIQGTN